MIKTVLHKNYPWYTILMTILLVVAYFLLVTLSSSYSIDSKVLSKYGAPYAVDIYLGHIYGVVTNNLMHLNFIHLIINLFGLWMFGAFLERRIGSWKMASLGLLCSLFGSLVQLAFTDDAGLGISSALFGFYAFIVVMSFYNPRFKIKFLYLYGALLLLFIILMSVNNELFGDVIAVESKIGGALCGMLMGFTYREEEVNWKKTFLFLFLPFVLLISTLFFAPWSSQWQTAKGIALHEEHQVDKAEEYYEEALALNPLNKVAKENLILVQIDRLSALAYNAHRAGDFSEARRYYLRILALKKNHSWALQNLKELP